jgi:HlyD family secretion protein
MSLTATSGFRNSRATGALGLLLGIALGVAGTYVLGSASPFTWKKQTDNVVTKTKVGSLGRIEPKGGVISVFGLPGDRIDKLSAKLGDEVAKDTVLAELASRKDRTLERDLVAVQLREARAQRVAIGDGGKAKIAVIDAELTQLESGRGDDLKAQDAKIAAIVQQIRVTRDGWDRAKKLLERSLVAPEDADKAELLYRQAEAELTAARAMRDKTEKGYEQNKAVLKAKRSLVDAEVDTALKQVPVDTLEEKLKIAERGLEATQIKAPVAGKVLKVIGHEGDTTGNQPILQLAQTGEMVVIAEVYETDVQTLDAWLSESPVQVKITSRALDKPLTGEVQRREIGHLIAKNQAFSLNPRQDVDRRVVEVRVDVQPDSVETASRYVGLEVNVEFEPSPKP